jgi:hypothetical protein
MGKVGGAPGNLGDRSYPRGYLFEFSRCLRIPVPFYLSCLQDVKPTRTPATTTAADATSRRVTARGIRMRRTRRMRGRDRL